MSESKKVERINYVLTILRNTDRHAPLLEVEDELNEAFKYLEEYANGGHVV